jgi:lysophospholipase L1-like esterase
VNFAWVNKVALVLLLSLQLFYSNAFAKNVCLGKQIKIVAIGDSFTQGGGHPDEYTYRLPLSIMLKNAGYDVDFIGTQHFGLNKSFKWPAGFDNEHEGYYGEPATYVAERLKVNLPKIASPDLALIHLGSGALSYRNVSKPLFIPLHSIVAQLRKKNPKVRILISEFHLSGFKAWYLRLNLILFAKYESTVESPVNSVPDYVGFTAGDTIDGVHPSLSGQKKMANAWFKSINLICNKE